MGMAASQARYLGLTARKTNVEYEGQQVNQARTALANQSANTFNELLALEVPTAPSTQDFTTLQYSYEDGSYSEVITSMTELTDDPNYNYLVTHYHYSDVFTGVQNNRPNPQVALGTDAVQGRLTNVIYDDVNDTYAVDNQPVEAYDALNTDQREMYERICQEYPDLEEVAPSDLFVYTDANDEMHFTTRTDLENAVANPPVVDEESNEYHLTYENPTYVGNCELKAYNADDPELKAAYDEICKQFPDSVFATSPEDEIYTYEYQGRTYFACEQDLRDAAISAPDISKPTENQNPLIQYYAEDIKTKIERQEKAFIDFDEKGRPYSIRYENSTAVLPLNTETITDEDAYNDAMNQYNYDMQVYEKKLADINAKTEQIQEQDRTLELRLRQLDTEQEALQTEMEAVKKVIEKNIESTFKTFE